jgi:hypothetical protein
MSAFSNYLEDEMNDHVLTNSAFSKPATVYLSLHTGDPGESGVASEVSGGSYARVSITNNNTNFPVCASTGTPTKKNGQQFVFPTSTAAWGTVTHWAIYDDDGSPAGNMLVHGSFSTPRYVASGKTMKVPAEAISITLTNYASGGMTDLLKRKVLDHVFGGPSYTPAASVYVGLGTALSGETITEWDDTDYTRQACAFDVSSGGVTQNAAAETFASSVVDADVTLSHFGIWDDASLGNLLYVGALTATKAVAIGDSFEIPDGGLVVNLD